VQTVLFDSKGVDKPFLDILETVQHEKAFRGLMNRRGRAMDLIMIQELHEEVFKGVMTDAGQWRRISVTIRGATIIPPRPEKIVGRMDSLVRDYDLRHLQGEDVFVLGSWMHHEFETIHPFSNGNGRVGRLLLNLHFLKHNWPSINIMPVDKDRYIEALAEGDKGNLIPLKEHIMKMMGQSILDLLSEVGTTEDELKPLAELKIEGKYSAKYLSLRAGQGELPAVKVKGDWQTSRRTLGLYIEELGRKSNYAP
jgi:Fic family protein